MANPRAIIEIDGTTASWTDILDIRVDNTLYLAADSFECTLDNGQLLSDWLRKDQEVRIYMGYTDNIKSLNKSELQLIFTGRIDGVKPSFDNTKTVQLLGRDYSAPMVDTDYTGAFKNVKSSDIAIFLAEKYKLKPMVRATTELLTKEMFADKKEWEVLQMLADLEGYTCYVTKDKELYFGERKQQDDAITDTLYYNTGESSNCKIVFDDSSIGVINKVTVRHWRHDSKKTIEASIQNDFLVKTMGAVKERIFYIPKASTYEMSKQYAEKLLKEYSRSSLTASGTRIPGNSGLYAECAVNVLGCGRFNGVYYMDSVTHSMNKQSGYVNTFQLTNLRPENSNQYRASMY